MKDASGFYRHLLLCDMSTGDQVGIGFFLSCPDGSFAYHLLKDFYRAVTFMEREEALIRDIAQHCMNVVREMSHEERRSYENHPLATVRFGGCGEFFNHDKKTLADYADLLHDAVLNEPGNITRQTEKHQAEEAARMEAA